MPKDVYTVVLYERRWKIRFDDRHVGPYATKAEAIAAAVEAAHKIGTTNPDGALVRMQGNNNGFRTEWTYGEDLYSADYSPPSGIEGTVTFKDHDTTYTGLEARREGGAQCGKSAW